MSFGLSNSWRNKPLRIKFLKKANQLQRRDYPVASRLSILKIKRLEVLLNRRLTIKPILNLFAHPTITTGMSRMSNTAFQQRV